MNIINSKYNEQDNDWAFDIKENPIHINIAESGAKGYFCMGCTKEMQAVKFKNPKHQSYFRHHVKDVDKSKVECVYSSKEYREKLAFNYFLRTKTIKVPAVYKYPPKDIEGYPVLLEDAKTIVAHRVDREVTFCEDEDGKIHSGRNIKVDERYLWIRPDAVFYDENDKPILFLEFVVTHKPDISKLNKLQRLGINTVQIIVPKLPEEALEKSISQVSKVKWTYNEIESNTEYISISSGNSEGIPSIDEEQRKLFEESYKCRAAQIGNLIRAINRCMESQSYRRVEQLFEREIQRIEEATTRERARLDEIQSNIESEIHSELGERREKLDREKQEFQEYSTNLEERYTTTRWGIIEKRRDIDREIEFRQQVGRTEENIREEFRKREEDIRYEFERTKRQLFDEERSIESEQEVITNQEGRITRDIESNTTFKNNFTRAEKSIESEFKQLEKEELENFERLRIQLESKINNYRKLQAEVEDGIRSEVERRYNEIVERINKGDIQTGDELSQRIKSILELRGFFDSYSKNQTTIEKFGKYQEIIRSGTWKKW